MRNRDFPRPRSYSEEEQDAPSLLTLLIMVNFGAFVLRLLFAIEPSSALGPAGYISMEELHRGHWWTVFTHIFVHYDWIHVTSNMVVLWLAGRAVLKQLGPRHFGYLYFLGGLAGTALELFVGKHSSETVLIGASGAAFAVMGAFAALNPYYSVTEPFRRWVAFRLRARSLVLGLILAEIILAVASRFVPLGSNLPGMDISHLCHVGGGIFGWIYALQARPAPSPFRRVRPSATQFLEEFGTEDDFAPFVPAGSQRRRKLAQDQTDELFAPPAPEPLSDQEFIRQNVNPVLEKLHLNGFESLTVQEKLVLDEAALRLRK